MAKRGKKVVVGGARSEPTERGARPRGELTANFKGLDASEFYKKNFSNSSSWRPLPWAPVSGTVPPWLVVTHPLTRFIQEVA